MKRHLCIGPMLPTVTNDLTGPFMTKLQRCGLCDNNDLMSPVSTKVDLHLTGT